MGYGDIVPVNNMERVINIFVLCFGATAFSFVVAYISDIIQNFNQVEAHNAARITEIKEFLAETWISSSLFKDIVGHFKTAMKHSSIFDEGLILSRLPCRIRDELLLYMHRQSLTTVPLFRYITNDSVKLFLLKQMIFQVVDVDRGMPMHPRLTHCFIPSLQLVNQVVDVGRAILREDDMGDEIVFVMKGVVEIATCHAHNTIPY